MKRMIITESVRNLLLDSDFLELVLGYDNPGPFRKRTLGDEGRRHGRPLRDEVHPPEKNGG